MPDSLITWIETTESSKQMESSEYPFPPTLSPRRSDVNLSVKQSGRWCNCIICLVSVAWFITVWQFSLLDPNKWALGRMTAGFACNLKPLCSKIYTVSSHYEIENRRQLFSSVVLFPLWSILQKLLHHI